jgi:hypothetical protein
MIRTITKKQMRGCKLYRSDTWVTNGEWAIPTTALVPGLRTRDGLITLTGITANARENMDVSLDTMAAAATVDGWTLTRWCYDGHHDRTQDRVVQGPDGQLAYLREAYVAFLGWMPGPLRTLSGFLQHKPFVHPETGIILMPVQISTAVDHLQHTGGMSDDTKDRTI